MTARRARVHYIDPRALPAPGRCLRADGIYRRRHGLPDKPELLTDEEIAALDPARLAQVETDEDRRNLL